MDDLQVGPVFFFVNKYSRVCIPPKEPPITDFREVQEREVRRWDWSFTVSRMLMLGKAGGEVEGGEG